MNDFESKKYENLTSIYKKISDDDIIFWFSRKWILESESEWKLERHKLVWNIKKTLFPTINWIIETWFIFPFDNCENLIYKISSKE